MKDIKLYGKTNVDLRRVRVTKKEAEQYKKTANKMRYFYSTEDGQYFKVNIGKIDPKKYKDNRGKLVLRDWGVDDITNKDIINPNPNKKLFGKIQITKAPKKADYEVTINYDFWISEENILRTYTYQFKDKINNLEQFARNYVEDFLGAFPPPFKFTDDDNVHILDFSDAVEYILENQVTVDSKLQAKKLKLNRIMRDDKPYDIRNLWGKQVEIKAPTKNCVTDIIEILHPKVSKSIIKNIVTTPDGLLEYCKKVGCKYILFNSSGNIIKSYYPEKQSKLKPIIGMSYNGHFYQVNNEILNRLKPADKIKIVKDAQKEFDELIEKRIIPANIKLTKKQIPKKVSKTHTIYETERVVTSFEHDNIRYIQNDEYDMCKEILNEFGLQDYLTPSIALSKVGEIIERLYYKGNRGESYFPININKGGFFYIKDFDHEKNYKKYKTIDYNKFYSNILRTLKYLIHVDYRTAEVTKFDKNPKELVPHYLYIAKPDKPNILLPNKDIYSGDHLLYSIKQGVKMEITEQIKTEKIPNHFSSMIPDIYDKIDGKLAKDIINKLIGKMQCNTTACKYIEIDQICNKDDIANHDDGFIHYKDDLYYSTKTSQIVTNLTNRKPIACQIKDYARVVVYEKLKELDISTDRLISIVTDAITFIDDGNFDDLDLCKGIDGWKEEEVKEIKFFKDTKCRQIKESNISFYQDTKIENRNILYNCYAGAGKTHFVINELIPSFTFGDDYIVLTPSHSASKEYKRNNINCKVIQTYQFKNESMPKESIIIVDEIGLCDRKANDFIIKCKELNKTIYSLGDFKQLLPVKESEEFSSKQFLDMMYPTQHSIKSNYRNNFTIEYYEKFHNFNKKLNAGEELKKYISKDYKKADIIICKTNRECEKYNQLMADYKKVKYTKNKNGEIIKFEPKEGIKIICNTNKLREKNIFNNFDYIIKDINDNEITLDDDTIITKKELNSNFQLGYAITTYKAQGHEYDSIFVPETSCTVNRRLAYTLISRIKQPLTKETKERNKKCKFPLP